MTDDPNQFPLKEGPAAALRRVADLIDRNPADTFSGVAVVFPPGGEGSIEILILDPSLNLAQFWSAVKGRIETTLVELDSQRNRQWTGR